MACNVRKESRDNFIHTRTHTGRTTHTSTCSLIYSLSPTLSLFFYETVCVCVRAGLGVYLWLFSRVLHDEIIIFSPWPSLAAILTFCLFPAMRIYRYIYTIYTISTCNILNVANSHVDLITIIKLGICSSDFSRLDARLRAQCSRPWAKYVSYL